MFRILIAEDEEPIANLIRMNLTKAGYLCTWAPDGKSAADLMEREKYDLALLDIMLPGINGYELMDYAKACELPVIFLTALGSTEHKVKGLRMGADDYLPKPFEIVELLARVEAVLRRYHKTEIQAGKCKFRKGVDNSVLCAKITALRYAKTMRKQSIVRSPKREGDGESPLCRRCEPLSRCPG